MIYSKKIAPVASLQSPLSKKDVVNIVSLVKNGKKSTKYIKTPWILLQW